MITKKIGKKTLEIYDDVQEIPEVRREKLDTYQILGSELNPRHSSFREKFQSVVAFIESDKKNDAIEGLQNIQKSLILCGNGNNLNRIAFGAIVKSINGKPNNNLSDEVLDKKIKSIKGLTTDFMEECIQNVKKNY